MNIRKKSIVRLALVSGLFLLLSGCMCLPGGMRHGSHGGAAEKKEAGEANGSPPADQTGEGDQRKEVPHEHGGDPADGEKAQEQHSGSGGHLGHMGLDLRSPWVWAVGGGMAAMMLLML